MISEVLWNHKCQPQSRKLPSWPRSNRNCWKETKEDIIELQINSDSIQQLRLTTRPKLNQTHYGRTDNFKIIERQMAYAIVVVRNLSQGIWRYAPREISHRPML
jgi:hypothetical protein